MCYPTGVCCVPNPEVSEVAKATEAQQLATMTDQEAAAYWNVLQFSARMMTVGDDGGKQERHVAIMDAILTERGIAHEVGALTKAAA